MQWALKNGWRFQTGFTMFNCMFNTVVCLNPLRRAVWEQLRVCICVSVSLMLVFYESLSSNKTVKVTWPWWGSWCLSVYKILRELFTLNTNTSYFLLLLNTYSDSAHFCTHRRFYRTFSWETQMWVSSPPVKSDPIVLRYDMTKDTVCIFLTISGL